MSLAESDRALVTDELGRSPTREEAALFENLWSEHCAYRSSRRLLGAFDSDGPNVVVGPGDDAAVVRVTDEVYLTLGIESHNHPSFVDPYDGAATGVGGIVRDTLSMGAYPIALADCLYFGVFEEEQTRYLFEGVVEGISDYGNAIGVPTVTGSVNFHHGYEGNPLVNVGCVGLVTPDRLVTADAKAPGNHLVLIGNATGRDGLGGASFASEDLGDDAETEDRPAVQVGDPYTEKLLIEANEALLDADLVEAARDLGAAGLGGASSEMVAKGGFGARIVLDNVHQREPGMSALEILLAESQERMCYEVAPANIARVRDIADRYDLGCSVVGEVTDGNYVCRFEGEVVVDVPAAFLGDGAPLYDRPAESASTITPTIPSIDLDEGFEAVVANPNTASKRWVYRQYDHEVGTRTAVPPGADAAVLALREADVGLAMAAGAEPHWTATHPYEGARAIALEVATNLAVAGATPLAAVDCLNGGNPEKPEVFGGFSRMVDGLAAMCRTLSVPVVGGNVSLYNDSASGPVPPTPTLFMVGTTDQRTAPSPVFGADGTLVLIGAPRGSLGGSALVAAVGGHDSLPELPASPKAQLGAIASVANHDSTQAIHDISHGGMAVTLAEMISPRTGAAVSLDFSDNSLATLFCEAPGRAVVQTTDVDAVRSICAGIAPVTSLGHPQSTPALTIETGERTLEYGFETIAEWRGCLDAALE